MRIRAAHERDAPALARVFIGSRRSAHRDHIPETSLLRISYEESERNWTRKLQEIRASAQSRERIFLAETDTGEPVGVAMGGPERTNHPRYAGEVYILYLLPAYQRQGIGRLLTQAVVAWLIQSGMPSFLIRVLKANTPARGFYEALGGSSSWKSTLRKTGRH